MNLYDQLGRDLNPATNTIDIAVNKDLSFTAIKIPTLTDTYKKQLATIALSVDVNINALLKMLTTDQIDQAINEHEDITWSHPETNDSIQLSEITFDRGQWWLGFEYAADGTHAGSWKVCDLNILDVLGFMETIENVMGL